MMNRSTDYSKKSELWRLGKDVFRTFVKVFKTNDPDHRRKILQSFGVERAFRMPVLFVDRLGLKYLLYPDQNPQVYIMGDGNYEVVEERFCTRYLKPGMTAIDVGGNIGIYALTFSKLVGPQGKVHSFEPEPKNFLRLSENVGLNQAVNTTINAAAVGASNGHLELNVYSEMFAAWHTAGTPKLPDPFNEGKFVDPDHTIKVPMVTLDSYCEIKNIQTIDFLKVDVEGGELDVVEGCTKLLRAGRIKVIQFEVSKPQVEGFGRSGIEVFDFLRKYGYSFYEILENGQLKVFENSLPANIYQNFIGASSGTSMKECIEGFS